jgi:SulP family sulfate permease
MSFIASALSSEGRAEAGPWKQGAAEFEEDLPAVENTERVVVLLRLRDRNEIGSTFIRVLERYASDLEAIQGNLVLSGVSEHIYHQLQKTDLVDQLGQENIYNLDFK